MNRSYEAKLPLAARVTALILADNRVGTLTNLDRVSKNLSIDRADALNLYAYIDNHKNGQNYVFVQKVIQGILNSHGGGSTPVNASSRKPASSKRKPAKPKRKSFTKKA